LLQPPAAAVSRFSGAELRVPKAVGGAALGVKAPPRCCAVFLEILGFK
jgi:hypothetical protein